VENGGIGSGRPILSLAAFGDGASGSIAAADSLGGVSVYYSIPPPGGPQSPGVPAAGGPVGRPGWRPVLAWVEMSEGAAGKTQQEGWASWPELVVLDQATGKGAIYASLARVAELRGIDGPLTRAVAAGDMDGDGFNEVVISTRDGKVGFWNLSGSASVGWPQPADPEVFPSRAAPLVAQLGSGSLDLVTATGSGRLFALGPDHRTLDGWPLGTGAGQSASPALLDLNGDGALELLIAGPDSLLYAFAPPNAAAGGGLWPVWGRDPRRTFSLIDLPSSGSPGEGVPLVRGTIACYPNPARRSPVTVSYRLNEPAEVTLTLYDPTGRRVGEVAQQGLASDNALIWDAVGQAPGLYLGNLVIRGTGKQENHLLHIGVLK
jgi:hypothetical protein